MPRFSLRPTGFPSHFLAIFCVSALTLAPLFVRSVSAQEAGYGGVGPINLSMAGAATAAPLDSSSALVWNPATIGALEKSEIYVGLTRTNAPWFGDEVFVSTIGIPLLAVGYLAVLSLDSEGDSFWETTRYTPPSRHREEEKTEEADDETDEEEGESTPALWGRHGVVRTFNFSFVHKLRNEKYAWGIAISENGALRNRLLYDPAAGKISGVETYRTKGFELLPSLSYRPAKNLYLGFSPVVTLDEFPTASLPRVAGPTILHRSRTRFGFGLQAGVFLQARDKWNFGFSVRSPQWIQRSTVEWLDPDGQRQRRRYSSAQDWPLRLSFGLAYAGHEKLLVAFDVRYYDFSHTESLFDVAGRSRRTDNLTSYALGIQWRPHPTVLALRIGYQFNDGASDLADYQNNTTLPIQRGHSIHYGLTWGTYKGTFDISFGISHGFGNGWIQYETADGETTSFDANPNNSTFSFGFRLLM